MKIAKDKLREVIASSDDIQKLVIVYQTRGATRPKAVHSLRNTSEAVVFVSEALRLSDEELLRARHFRP